LNAPFWPQLLIASGIVDRVVIIIDCISSANSIYFLWPLPKVLHSVVGTHSCTVSNIRTAAVLETTAQLQY
jgi:hypothetical protein